MYPLSDKDLDRLSKEAAEQYDVEQNTSGWEQLEQKLNKDLPATKRDKRRFLFFLSLVALLTGSGLFWMLTGEKQKRPYVLTNKTQPNKSVENSNTTSLNQTSDQKKTNESENRFESEDKLLSQKTSGEKTTPPMRITSETKNIPLSANQSKELTSVSKDNQNQRSPAERKLRSKTRLDKPLTKEKINSKGQLPSPIIEKIEDENKIAQKEDATVKSGTVPDQGIAKTDVAAKTNDTDKTIKDNKTDQVIPTNKKISSTPKSKKYPLEIGLVAGPDFSNVKFTHADKAGINYGVQIGYRFSKRLSINTGLLYTKKNYSAYGRDYHPPKGYWTYNPSVKLNKVYGDCSMFDIPLNIRYDFYTRNKNNYFVSSGLSSYLMDKEDYTYYYLYYSNSTSRHVSYETDDKYWLSVMNFSAGYERSLSKNFSLQAEPYLKIPVKGVGFGHMKLNSYGIYFSVKYKPGFNSLTARKEVKF